MGYRRKYMGFKMGVRSLLSMMILGSSLLVAQGFSAKKFDIRSGEVLFKIQGGGTLTDNVTIAINGDGVLHFKEWGKVALLEENYEEVTGGVLKHIKRVQLGEKFDDKQHFEVDYEQEKIFERDMPKGNFRDYYLKGLKRTGTETIAGHECEVWEAEGIKKCLYKGIPLLIEHYLLGVYYEKRAVEVTLSDSSVPSKYMLPEYPVERFSLFTTNIKTKSVKLPKEFSEVILTVSKEVQKRLKKSHLTMDDLTEVQKREIFDRLGQNIFEEQKIYLPEVLTVMKEARLCLQQANDIKQANVCIADLVKIKQQVSKDVRNEIDEWNEKSRAQVLNGFEESITFLESNMKCIRASQDLHDLSNCMKTEQ